MEVIVVIHHCAFTSHFAIKMPVMSKYKISGIVNKINEDVQKISLKVMI